MSLFQSKLNNIKENLKLGKHTDIIKKSKKRNEKKNNNSNNLGLKSQNI